MRAGETRRSEIERLEDLPKGLEWIWHGVNDAKNLELFVKSNIFWAEGDVRAGSNGSLILRHDSYETHPSRPSEEELDFRTWLQSIFRAGKGAQIDLKEGADTLERMLAVLRDVAMPGERLWFTTNLKDVAMEDYARLAREFPRVPVQSAIPLRFMFQEMGRDEREAWLELNRGLGVRHLAMSWYDEPKTSELEEIRQAGFGVHFFYVNSAEDIRRAVSLGPDSITSDFHIPEWGVFGRGSGENGFYLEKS